jgi:hypothetical protein
LGLEHFIVIMEILEHWNVHRQTCTSILKSRITQTLFLNYEKTYDNFYLLVSRMCIKHLLEIEKVHTFSVNVLKKKGLLYNKICLFSN